MRRLAALLLPVLLLVAGCRERLTAPADCPTLCPGARVTTIDTVITALPNLDSTYSGFVGRSEGGLLVSSGLAVSEDRILVRFGARPDTLPGARPYVIDSVDVGFTLVARDTAARNVRLVLYRVPRTLDTLSGFAQLESALVPANVIDSLSVADTLIPTAARPGRIVLFTLRGPTLERVALAAGDSGTLAIGLRMRADRPSGLRFASAITNTTAPPAFTTYVRTSDQAAGTAGTPLQVTPVFATTISQLNEPAVPQALTLGASPSSRAIVRFALPPRIRDSAQIVRATLELVPVRPIRGLPNDPAGLAVRPVLADLGAKSVLLQPGVNDPGFGVLLPHETADTVRVEIGQILSLWQAQPPIASSLMLIAVPEASTFSRPVFGSTRTGAPPRIRITYQLPFPFARP